MSVASRISEIVAGMTQAEVAERLGEKPKRVNDILRGKQRVPEDFLIKFIEVFQVDANWLFTGCGSPGQLTPREAALLDNYRHCPDDAKRSAETMCALLAQSSAGKKKAG